VRELHKWGGNAHRAQPNRDKVNRIVKYHLKQISLQGGVRGPPQATTAAQTGRGEEVE
jgi:hypothetical protein